MSYNYKYFLKPITTGVRNIQVIDGDGVIKYTLNPFFIVNSHITANTVKINLKNDKFILLDFNNSDEAKSAIGDLQSQIDILTQEVPFVVDKNIENFIVDYVQTGTQGPILSSYVVANVNSSSVSTLPVTLTSAAGDIHIALYDAGVKTPDITVSNGSSQTLTFNTAGVYEVAFNFLGWQLSSNVTLQWKIKKNGTVVATFLTRNTSNGSPLLLVGSMFVSITSGQYIDVYVSSAGSSTLTFDVNTSTCTVNAKRIA